MLLTGIDIPKILALAPSPAYVVDLGRLRHNLAILDEVQQRSGAKILMALKAFAMWSAFPLIRETLHGVCASSPWEARLGREEFGREVHSFAAAFKESDVVELLAISNHLVFNSFAQLERFRPLWEKAAGRVSIGLRVNPEHSEGAVRPLRPLRPLLAPRHPAPGVRRAGRWTGSRAALPHPVRAAVRAAGSGPRRSSRRNSVNSCRG